MTDISRARDLVHWAPIWAGVFISIAVLLMLTPLGVALGLTDATGATIWGAVSLIVGFFIGGWVVGRTMSYEDGLLSGAHGLLCWAVTISFLLLFAALLGLGAAGAVGGTTTTPAAGTVPQITIPASTITGATLGTFLALLVSGVACIAGSIVGNTTRTAVRRTY
jgi:hypothetical protein